MSDFETVAATENQAARRGVSGEPGTPGRAGRPDRARSLAGDAWRDLRRNPVFWISLLLVVLVAAMAVAPGLFAANDPRDCVLSRQHAGPSGGAIFGYDFQGCDTFARAVYGARASLLVGAFSALITGVIALVVGMLAGYFGGWVDAVLSRVIDIVLGIPLLLAAIVLLKRVSTSGETVRLFAVILVLALLGWTTAARVVRSSVITAREQDYVAAARMLGAGNGRIMWRHILPNALAPAIVVLTIALGSFIAAEATLSFLGIGLKAPTISWGIDIDAGRVHMRESATPLIVPSTFLALTVLAFIMLGDAIRDAFDPKLR
ncbi:MULTISPECIES: ABC transporter permease [Micromonospora]|uniref:ABC transporter permease n=1 Tax=Micromonospora aurantiaca (nom. illeg.) TaxID=47850 RepID=A0A3M9KS45_9ACTN|nr:MULTISPECIES: ABC transporter permease [Micromonospora]AXH89061.1 ABC transporter permease [Micromonospora aurantiaca]KAB1117741.1 ABC transporter permease [Micromonospora aurantiaca]MDW3850149.1 ABC transporter permease [Micromonospora sp. BRA006-A]RNI03844.1 ABC transporter permease [Micromonospora aurantiaca]UFN93845.1 ABC transporter permease [Micromonospora aurantiaca]